MSATPRKSRHKSERSVFFLKTKAILRIVSLAMLIAAAVFVLCALSNPGLGRVFYIGSIKIGADVKRIFYAAYLIVMAALFGISFLVKNKK